MSFSYDNSNLDTDTASGRLNTVRLLLGDTDSSDPQIEDEEIDFALGENGENVYYAAAWAARVIGNKYARQVDIDLDGQLDISYSDLSKQYYNLAERLDYQGKKSSGSLGMIAGGIKESEMEAARDEANRVKPSFRRDQFRNPPDVSYFDYRD